MTTKQINLKLMGWQMRSTTGYNTGSTTILKTQLFDNLIYYEEKRIQHLKVTRSYLKGDYRLLRTMKTSSRRNKEDNHKVSNFLEEGNWTKMISLGLRI